MQTQDLHQSGERSVLFTIARIIFGSWFLFSGAEYFSPFDLQPLGNTPLAREFTLAPIHSGLFAWIKVLEVVVGLLLLINRAILPAALATAPVTGGDSLLELRARSWADRICVRHRDDRLQRHSALAYCSQLLALLKWRD